MLESRFYIELEKGYSLNLSSVFHRGPRETATHLRGADAR